MFSSPREIHTLGSQFWFYHLWLPLLFVVPTLYLFDHSSIDVVFADFWYQLEGGYWALRMNWFTYDVMHRDGKRLIILIGLAMLALYAASWKFDRLRPWRCDWHGVWFRTGAEGRPFYIAGSLVGDHQLVWCTAFTEIGLEV